MFSIITFLACGVDYVIIPGGHNPDFTPCSVGGNTPVFVGKKESIPH